MRVIHVITRLILGGAQENTVASVLGLRQRHGLDTRLIAGPATGPEGSLVSSFNDTPHHLIQLPTLVRPPHPWKDFLALRSLRRLFAAQQPHLVHTHSGKAGILGRCAARMARVPVVVHTIHGPSFGSFQGWVPNALFRASERFAARFTTHFVSVAEAMTRQYLAAGIGRPTQYTRLYSGFSLDPFLRAASHPCPRADFGLTPEDFVVGQLARLAPLKGHDDLLALAPRLLRRDPSCKFLLVGDGPWRARLEQRVRSLGLSRQVIFTGLVRPDQVPPLLALMDAVVHLSRREGLARALPQALAVGKPILAYDCDGAGEVCLEDQTGFLIPVGRLDLLAERLLRLAADPGLRERLGQRGRRLVTQLFSVEKMVDDLHALYLRLWAQTGLVHPEA